MLYDGIEFYYPAQLLRTIRLTCLDCCNCDCEAVKACIDPTCPLHPYRLGFPKKDEKKAASKQGQKNLSPFKPLPGVKYSSLEAFTELPADYSTYLEDNSPIKKPKAKKDN